MPDGPDELLAMVINLGDLAVTYYFVDRTTSIVEFHINIWFISNTVAFPFSGWYWQYRGTSRFVGVLRVPSTSLRANAILCECPCADTNRFLAKKENSWI
jgi:hypothetical protein